MLIDDNADSRSIIREMLAAQGASVTVASSGTQALAQLRRDDSRAAGFQVLLLDGAMLGPHEFDVVERFVNGEPGPQIVMMLRTNDLTNQVARLRAIGVGDYIVKPVRRADLFAAMARACEATRTGLRDNRPASPPAAPVLLSAMLNRPLQILLADDSPDNRALIQAYLKRTPYSLEEAEDGRQAIDKFIAGQFDLVLMDIQMPIVDGYEAASTIRRWERANNRRRTPIVALTASALEEAVHRTKAAGCDAHVTKPVRKATLLEAIRDAIETTRFDDAEVDTADLKEETCPIE